MHREKLTVPCLPVLTTLQGFMNVSDASVLHFDFIVFSSLVWMPYVNSCNKSAAG